MATVVHGDGYVTVVGEISDGETLPPPERALGVPLSGSVNSLVIDERGVAHVAGSTPPLVIAYVTG